MNSLSRTLSQTIAKTIKSSTNTETESFKKTLKLAEAEPLFIETDEEKENGIIIRAGENTAKGLNIQFATTTKSFLHFGRDIYILVIVLV